MNKTRKITYTAVGAAVSAVCVFLTNFGWLNVSLLMAAALCYYVVCCKCNLWYGVACIVVSLGLAAAVGGVFSFSAFFLDAFIFAPFALISYAIRSWYYTRWQTALLRLLVMAVFANVALVAVWFTAQALLITTINIAAIAAKVGGYAVFALIFTAMSLVFDFLFNQLSIRIIKILK